jgi:hypothetical protein
MPVKKSTRSKASAASKKPDAPRATSKPSAPSQRQFSTGAMLVAAMCVTGAVIVIAAHGRTPSARVSASGPVVGSEAASAEPKAVVPASATVVVPESTATPEADSAKTSATAPVTIFGCLERSNDTYRLTDTDGVDAPKARSWKSAFMKKGAATVEVVDPGNRTHLSSQVGHRVGVTGTLTERQLQARSIRRISASCTD